MTAQVQDTYGWSCAECRVGGSGFELYADAAEEADDHNAVKHQDTARP